MSRPLQVLKAHVSSPKAWIVIGVTVAGVVFLAEVHRRRRRAAGSNAVKEDFGAFLMRFELLPSPQPPPPALKQPLAGLTFAIKDIFEVKGYVTGYGNPDWERTHEAAGKTAVVITALLKNGAKCVGKTVMDELGFGMTGENIHHGTPVNPQMPSHIPGGSSAGSAVAVAAELVDFALGTDTAGCVRIPASLCGIIGYRPSHGAVSTTGVLPNSQSLDTIGWFARDPSILHRVGRILLQLNTVEPRRPRKLVFADDLFGLSKVPKHKSLYVVRKAAEKLSGYQPPKHINFGQHIASKVPSLKVFCEQSTNLQNGMSALKALSSAMLSLQRCEFKTNHEEWVKSVKPRLGPRTANCVLTAVNTSFENIKTLYEVKSEMRAAIQNLLKNCWDFAVDEMRLELMENNAKLVDLKDDGILIIPTVADPPLPTNLKKRSSAEFFDRALALISISSMSGCCQVSIPLGKHDGCPISVSFISYHGGDKFLLDSVLDMYSSIQEQVAVASSSLPFADTNGNLDTSELLKEKGNAAYKGCQWNKAVTYYSEAIKLHGTNATYYCNRAAAYLQLGCFEQAEEDCTKAILLDKKNVKAYLRRGTARESLIRNKEALQDFAHALVLEPQNKNASHAEKRLRKMLS